MILIFQSNIIIFFSFRINQDEIECINQACTNNIEELSIQVHNHQWQIEKTNFQCRNNPIIYDWYPKRSILR